MKSLLRLLSVFVVFSFVTFSSVSVFADPKLMSLEETEKLVDSSPSKAVNAYFESVERGIKIKRYDITVRGVYREPGLTMVLFTTSHKIVAGMSGSPVYINGKKIGALAYRVNNFNFSKPSWGGISPISLMLKDADSGYQSKPVKAFSYRGMIFEPIALGPQSIKGLEGFAGGKFMITSQISQGASFKIKKPVFRAGMPIVVDLVEWTDEKGETASISAMGTITHIDDSGRVFAFGHPFLDAKKVVYGFRTAEVVGTVFSEDSPFKLSGKRSEILGAITVDSLYGIYGSTSLNELKRLHHFSLKFKREGKSIHEFDIKIADSVMTPIIAQAAFANIGKAYGAPLAQESSVTQIESRIDLEGGYKPITWKGLFASYSIKFGAATLRSSSYDVASENFLTNIYDTLFDNSYDLKISNVSVSVNFVPGKSRVYKLGAYKFPNKVVYGQNPVLDIMFVDENNLMPIAKKVTVAIDWSKVEKPVYAKETIETEKVSEKVIRGMIRISGAEFFVNTLSSGEKQKLLPEYFLGPEDFLENLSKRLEINNQKIFIRVALRAKSGLLDEAIVSAKDIMPNGISSDDDEWYVIKGGLKDRKVTIKNEGVVMFSVGLPNIPDGYVLEQNFQEIFVFEVVLDK